MKRASLLFVVTVASLLLGYGDAWGQVGGKIFGDKGTPTEGTITGIDHRQLTMSVVGGGERSFPIESIRKVTFTDEPIELDNARSLARENRFNDAKTELDKINATTVRIITIKQEIEFYQALCAAKLALSGESGSPTTAATLFAKWLESEKNSPNFHYYEALEVQGQLAMTLGRFPEAEALYADLGKGSPTDIQVRAKVLVGLAQLAQGKYPEALSNFQQVEGLTSVTTPEATRQKLFAKIGRAVYLASTGKPDEGIALVQKIIAEEDPKDMELFGRAYNALGACYLKAAKPNDALLAYLHTDILFYGDPSTHAEALYNLTNLWQQVKKPDRAVRARGTLKSRYSGSLWATKE